MGRFCKIFPNFNQNWLKFKKISEKSGDYAQNFAQNWAAWYMNESLFLEKLVFVWDTLKFRGGTSLPKPSLSTPPPVPDWFLTQIRHKSKLQTNSFFLCQHLFWKFIVCQIITVLYFHSMSRITCLRSVKCLDSRLCVGCKISAILMCTIALIV